MKRDIQQLAVFALLTLLGIGHAKAQFAHTPVDADSMYNAFPGMVQMPDGKLILYYKKGTDHVGSDDIQAYKTSTDKGKTWSSYNKVSWPDSALKKMAGAQPTLLSNGKLILAFSSSGVGFSISDDSAKTWGNLIKLNSSFNYLERTSAKVVELSNGHVVCAFNGKDSNETYLSAHMLVSKDKGLTWEEESLIADGNADSIDYADPNLVLLSTGKLVCLLRTGEGIIHVSSSTDNGVTWSDPAPAFPGQGSPRAICDKNDSIWVFFRSRLIGPYRHKIALRKSGDGGLTWYSDQEELILDTAGTTTNGMLYASPVLFDDNSIGLSYSVELDVDKADVRYMVLNSNINGVSVHNTNRVVTVYPNPAEQFLWINTETPFSCLEIVDMTGRRLKTYPAETGKSSTARIDLGEYRSAPYILRIIFDDGIVEQRILRN